MSITKLDMISHNLIIYGALRWGAVTKGARWKEPRKLLDKIEVIDKTDVYFGLYGYIIGRRDEEWAVYIPMSKTLGFSKVYKFTACRRM